MNISTTLNVRKILITVIVVATTLTASNGYSQSFLNKVKKKAKSVKSISNKSNKLLGNKKIGNKLTSAKGGYHLLEAERSPAGGTTKTLIIQEADDKGQKVMVSKACNNCTPLIYRHQEEPSTTLKIPVYFSAAGMYLLGYDAESFVVVMPDKQLGKAPFGKLRFSNFYSKNSETIKTMTKAKAEAYAIEMSKKILAPSSSGSSKGGNGTYSAAIPVKFSGNAYEELVVTFEEGAVKKIITEIKKGNKVKSTDTYLYLEEYSKLTGVAIYANSVSHLNQYIYVDKPGVLIWTRYKNGGLGHQLWEKYDHYNMFAMDKQIVRGLLNSKSQQKEIDVKIAKWSKIIKESEDKKREEKNAKKIANQRLPKKGLIDNSLKAETLQAAKNWATKWGWKETVTKAYFTGTDWSIVRHSLTGIQLRREIRGVIVMKRPDGGCSFHYALFAQEYDGSKYLTVYTAGITPGQIKLNCEYAK